jgi:hypothetical protein
LEEQELERFWDCYESLALSARFVAQTTECPLCARRLTFAMMALLHGALLSNEDLNGVLCAKCDQALDTANADCLNDMNLYFSEAKKASKVIPAWKAKPSDQ